MIIYIQVILLILPITLAKEVTGNTLEKRLMRIFGGTGKTRPQAQLSNIAQELSTYPTASTQLLTEMNVLLDSKDFVGARNLLKNVPEGEISNQLYKNLVKSAIEKGDSQFLIDIINSRTRRSVMQELEFMKLARELKSPSEGSRLSRSLAINIGSNPNTHYYDLFHGHLRTELPKEKAERLASKFTKTATNDADRKIWADILDDIRGIKPPISYYIGLKQALESKNFQYAKRLLTNAHLFSPEAYHKLVTVAIMYGDEKFLSYALTKQARTVESDLFLMDAARITLPPDRGERFSAIIAKRISPENRIAAETKAKILANVHQGEKWNQIVADIQATFPKAQSIHPSPSASNAVPNRPAAQSRIIKPPPPYYEALNKALEAKDFQYAKRLLTNAHLFSPEAYKTVMKTAILKGDDDFLEAALSKQTRTVDDDLELIYLARTSKALDHGERFSTIIAKRISPENRIAAETKAKELVNVHQDQDWNQIVADIQATFPKTQSIHPSPSASNPVPNRPAAQSRIIKPPPPYYEALNKALEAKDFQYAKRLLTNAHLFSPEAYKTVMKTAILKGDDDFLEAALSKQTRTVDDDLELIYLARTSKVLDQGERFSTIIAKRISPENRIAAETKAKELANVHQDQDWNQIVADISAAGS